ncbi:MAG: chemotaxis protein CheW [Gammaproteobacteria bacterium]|nr:chemotaxis protein CheW [Gammaproteobacteria bacterium]
MSEPFQRLLEIEQKCRASAAVLPGLDSDKDEWSGIGFRIGGTEFLSKMGEVTEILDPPEYTRIPGVQSWVVGIANVRGSLLPLMDLKGFITGESLANRKNGRVLVINHNGVNIGLIVDEVLGMRHFFLSEKAYELPEMENNMRPYIKQAFLRDKQYWPVFSFHSLVEDERFLHASL